MLSRFTGLILLFACVNPSFAQIKGTIIDSQTSAPLIGVHITSENESVISDENGVFSITGDHSEIIISHLGYQPDTLSGNEIYYNMVIRLSPSVHELEQVNIRGSFNEYPIMQMPSNIGYIKNIAEAHSEGISFVDNLNRIPGVFVQAGTLNTNRIIIRGIGSRAPYATNRIKAYYNDIPLTTGDGTTEIEDLNALDIGSVEILKGSKSALYGSGLGGVIRLNKEEVQEDTHVTIRSTAASYLTFKTDVGISLKKKGYFFRSNLSDSRSEGYRQNSRYNRLNFLINTGFSNDNNQLDILFMNIDTKAYIPSSLNEQMFNENPENAAPNWYSVQGYEKYKKIISGISYKHSFTEKLSNKISLFAQSYSGYESRPFNILDDNSVKLGFRNIATYQWNKNKVQAGIESMSETYNWDIYETLAGEQGEMVSTYSEKRQPISMFLNLQTKLFEKIIVEAGVSMNTLKYELEDRFGDSVDLSGKYNYDMVLSPFLGINLPVSSAFRIYSSLSNGFSAPSVEETLLPEGAINPELKPETGVNTEIGIRFQDKKKKVFADACIYSIWVKNLLVTKRETEEIFYGANAGKSWHKGIELNSKIWLKDADSQFPVSLNINYTFTHAVFTNYIDDGIDFSGNKLPGIPEQNLFLSANIESPPGIYINPTFQFTGQQFMDDSNTKTDDPYAVFNLKSGWSKNLNLIKINVALGIRNIFNEHYASMVLVNAPSFGGAAPRYYYPGMERNWFLTVGMGF